MHSTKIAMTARRSASAPQSERLKAAREGEALASDSAQVESARNRFTDAPRGKVSTALEENRELHWPVGVRTLTMHKGKGGYVGWQGYPPF